MIIQSAIIIMQRVVDHYSMDFAEMEAWETLRDAALAQATADKSAIDVSVLLQRLLSECDNTDVDFHISRSLFEDIGRWLAARQHQ